MSPRARFSQIELSDTHPTPTRLRVGVQRRLPHQRTAPVNPLDSRDKNGARSLRRMRSEEHTSELQSRGQLVCRLLLDKKMPVMKCILKIKLQKSTNTQ